MRWLLRHPWFSIPATVAVVAALAWLVFGFFAVHLLFVDDRVDEAVPVFDAAPVEAAAPSPTTVAPTVPPTASATVPSTVPASPATVAPTTVAPTTSPSVTVTPTTSPPAAPVVVTEYTGEFASRDHPTSGTAVVLGNGTGQRFLRFEGFETDNGPDLNVYLVNRAAGGVNDVVDLGDLKGNVGDQNYELPAGVDLETYDTVLIWCVRFSSPFGEATLSVA